MKILACLSQMKIQALLLIQLALVREGVTIQETTAFWSRGKKSWDGNIYFVNII
jgi:hypothetical protein